MGTGVEIELNIINIRLSQIQEGDNLHIETYEKIGLHKRYIHHTEKRITQYLLFLSDLYCKNNETTYLYVNYLYVFT